ncbi:uncharacterized protein DDB_G0292186-like [Gigantopelta aegis]|uniref:uncharacterized protein DDB_G0292186-like n=1 Tax=Gigantopelta aegis TaxID=1735272 RepID=UPI001B888CB2|nr:uncharacterized protein DDB_G0292186-like [Gigantopelta aegis]XP_041370266.1 uncharacterized protein DDB_G0292186-like [Gigantopelta aegis]
MDQPENSNSDVDPDAHDKDNNRESQNLSIDSDKISADSSVLSREITQQGVNDSASSVETSQDQASGHFSVQVDKNSGDNNILSMEITQQGDTGQSHDDNECSGTTVNDGSSSVETSQDPASGHFSVQDDKNSGDNNILSMEITQQGDTGQSHDDNECSGTTVNDGSSSVETSQDPASGHFSVQDDKNNGDNNILSIEKTPQGNTGQSHKNNECMDDDCVSSMEISQKQATGVQSDKISGDTNELSRKINWQVDVGCHSEGDQSSDNNEFSDAAPPENVGDNDDTGESSDEFLDARNDHELSVEEKTKEHAVGNFDFQGGEEENKKMINLLPEQESQINNQFNVQQNQGPQQGNMSGNQYGVQHGQGYQTGPYSQEVFMPAQKQQGYPNPMPNQQQNPGLALYPRQQGYAPLMPQQQQNQAWPPPRGAPPPGHGYMNPMSRPEGFSPAQGPPGYMGPMPRPQGGPPGYMSPMPRPQGGPPGYMSPVPRPQYQTPPSAPGPAWSPPRHGPAPRHMTNPYPYEQDDHSEHTAFPQNPPAQVAPDSQSSHQPSNDPPASQHEQGSTTIRVFGFGKAISPDFIKSHFSSENNSGGGDIKEFKHDSKKNAVYITFYDEKVAKRVLSKKSHKIHKQKLKVELYDESTVEEKKTEPINSIIVRGKERALKDEDVETVEMYFENKRKSGGGSIEKLQHDKNKKAIYITFEEEGVAQSVLRKVHKIGKTTLKVELYNQSTVDEKKTEPINSIVVRGKERALKDEDVETVELYFENKRKSGGGSIEKLQHDRKKKAIYIIFEEEGVAQRVMSKAPHKIGERTLQVELFDASSAVEETETKAINSIVVKGFKETEDTETVEMYFESTKKSGGGSVERIQYDKNKGVIHITFEEEGVAERVVGRQHKLQGRVLTVMLDTAEEEEDTSEEPDDPLTTVVVKGCDSNISNDSITLYFENKRRGGGVNIEKIQREENGLIYITFETEDDVKKVMEKSHRIEGNRLTMQVYHPPKMYQDKFLLTNIPDSTSPEMICNFIEAKVHCQVAEDDSILYGEDPGVVLVSVEDKIDFKEVSTNLTKKKLAGHTLEVRRVPVSKSIIVKNVPAEISADALRMYFENKRRSGGGDILNFDLHTKQGCATITFEEEQGKNS